MKDKNAQMDYEQRTLVGSKNDVQVQALLAEKLKTLISKITDSMTWGNSVIKVVFKDEFFEEKYRLKVENFLMEMLDADETFILTPQVFDKTELTLLLNKTFWKVKFSYCFDNLGSWARKKAANYEFKNIQNSIQAEKANKSSHSVVKAHNSIPIYSSEFEDVLHCDEPEIEELIKEEKPPTMTCFNCLGDHHMNRCPEKIDRLRVAENKKDVLLDNSSRYHEEERKNAVKPGNISSELRLAMGLKHDQLPQYIYTMRIIGYPPGWMDDARFETSGLALYDSQGNAMDEPEDLPDNNKKYDSSKFVEYPGFNCPVPSDFKDEWKTFGMLPMQPHQQLSETVKAENTINTTNVNKRKSTSSSEDAEESKKIRNGANDAKETLTDCYENCSTPKKTEHLSSCSTPLEKSSGISLCQSPGTPILKQGNPFEKLPDANKFAQGITEHLPFENLPESVGKFEKIRGVLSDVQKKLQNIKNNR